MVTMFAVAVLAGIPVPTNVSIICGAVPEYEKVGAAAAVLVCVIVAEAGFAAQKLAGKLTVILSPTANAPTVPTVKVKLERVVVPGTRVVKPKLGLLITPPTDTAACIVDAKSYGVLRENPPQEAATGAPDLKLFAEEDVRVTVSAAAVMAACAVMVIFVDVTLTAPVKLPVAVAVPTK